MLSARAHHTPHLRVFWLSLRYALAMNPIQTWKASLKMKERCMNVPFKKGSGHPEARTTREDTFVVLRCQRLSLHEQG